MPRFDNETPIRGDFHPNDHRTATDLAILHVFLLIDRSIEKDGYQFTTVRAADVRFL